MKGLRVLLEDLGTSKFSFKGEREGICEFCGREGLLSRKTILEKIKGSNHPAIFKSQEGLAFICEECSYIYSQISTTRPSKFFKDRYMVVVEEGRYYHLEDLYQIKQLPEGRYFFIYPLTTSNFMPINFYDLKPTINPLKNLNINYTEGTVFKTFEIETGRFFELLEGDDKSIHIINSLRKKYIGGRKDGKN